MRLEAFADVLAWVVIGLWILGRAFGVFYWFTVRKDLVNRVQCHARGVDPDTEAWGLLIGRGRFWLAMFASVAWLATGAG